MIKQLIPVPRAVEILVQMLGRQKQSLDLVEIRPVAMALDTIESYLEEAKRPPAVPQSPEADTPTKETEVHESTTDTPA